MTVKRSEILPLHVPFSTALSVDYKPRRWVIGRLGGAFWSMACVRSMFGKLMLAGKRPKCYGYGKSRRDYGYVANIAWANLLALEKGDGKTLNLDSEEGTDFLSIFRHFQGILEYPDEPELLPLRQGEIQNSNLMGEQAKKVLDWRPDFGLGQFLLRKMEYVRSRKARRKQQSQCRKDIDSD